MEEFEVILLPSAEEDLINIYNYISKELNSEINAKRVISRIESEIHNLNILPESYHLIDFEPWRSKGLRHFPVGNYQVFYIVDNDKNIVYILNILYGKMNFQEIWK